MSENSYVIDNTIRCSVAFTDASNAQPVDPLTVKFAVLTPTTVKTSYTYGVDAQLVKASTGNYYVDVLANLAGYWSYHFEGYDGVGYNTKEQMRFYIDKSLIT